MTALGHLAGLEPHAMRFGPESLARVERALEALARPDRAYPSLHVAGTNGKGSTCACAAEALSAAGRRVGLYTSPHLVRFHERIRVGGDEISDGELEERVGELRAALPWHESNEDRLSYFEFVTVLALHHFARSGVEVAVLEVGLGGRLDATNVVTPRVCAVTRIGLDHTAWLGGTLELIAREKAGIFKRGVPAVVAADQPPDALAALRDEADRRGAPFHVAAASFDGAVSLRGRHQGQNAALAAAALRLLGRAGAGMAVPEEAIRRGIATARWPGRLEEIAGVLLDGAHNADGVASLSAALDELYPGRPVELVFGVLADKDHAAMLRLLAGRVRTLHLVPPSSARARPTSSYRALADGLGFAVREHPSCAEALREARAAAVERGGLACVAGSLYLVGEARALLLSWG